MPQTTFTTNAKVKTTLQTERLSLATPNLSHPLIVFTDLDGTLLDHDDYRFDAALPALEKLRQYNIPLVIVSSKTAAELIPLRKSLRNTHPFIAENGSVIGIPEHYFPKPGGVDEKDAYWYLRLAPAYDEILAILHAIRNNHQYRFTGFHDMTDEAVAEDTGLAIEQASLARQRLCSEPLRWQDTGDNLSQFINELKQHRLNLVKGGRYWHVLADVDKKNAMHEILKLYQRNRLPGYTAMALGDSPNDLSMLQSADIAVVIRHKDGSAMPLDSDNRVIVSDAPGPEGWNEAVLSVLQDMENTLFGEKQYV
jgi:mannosyl-3-phosphoglycerate phosphatase